MSAAARRALAAAVRGRVCVLALGNRDRGDDGAGPALVDLVRDRVDAPCFDGGIAPENLLEAVAREDPDVVLLVDAAAFGGRPGEVRVTDPARHRGRPSTHAPSLALAAAYLRERCGAVVRLLAIQPASAAPGPHLSPAVQESVRTWADRLTGMLRAGAAVRAASPAGSRARPGKGARPRPPRVQSRSV